MNPILEQIYATILPSAPYVIAAYALVWLALLVYVVLITVRLKKTEAQMAVLEEALAAKEADATDSITKK
ncbi:MAG: CcmD family protein [Eggerthellaceae bacterium]|jgi:CcmD family protein|uniref:CcmD family protein n=1 Tax=Denitrobacterium detoxificans TaxID=79604 RepID=A0A172RX19_9ACTN|nr:CcmD family protein [Denitrobacterium detoxificans]ANE22259.1 heme exporter protein CcmD [Denitrobacterium detoxificans]MBE6465545.1 CcmD family protein [Denitrobacterium detoxificans]MCR5582964.1 CcmD family protein [Eggerthellaceae bacterium]SEO63430.1 CcmD family protein [Denitrobacterium detoxificans]